MEAISIGSLDSSSHDTNANLHRYSKKKNSYILPRGELIPTTMKRLMMPTGKEILLSRGMTKPLWPGNRSSYAAVA
jgi:hypothetical protein